MRPCCSKCRMNALDDSSPSNASRHVLRQTSITKGIKSMCVYGRREEEEKKTLLDYY